MLTRLILHLPLIFLSATLVAKSPTLEIAGPKQNTASFKILPSTNLEESAVFEAEDSEEQTGQDSFLYFAVNPLHLRSLNKIATHSQAAFPYFSNPCARPSSRAPPLLAFS